MTRPVGAVDGAADDVLDAIETIAQLPGVPQATRSARTACEEFRWHEAFRRRGAEVRVEAGVRSAQASAAVDGARVPVEAVRALAVGAPRVGRSGASGGEVGDAGSSDTSAPQQVQADVLVATGALRAAAQVERWMPELAARGAVRLAPFGELLAGLHRVVATGWLPDGAVGRVRTGAAPLDLQGLGAAPDGAEVAARIDLLARVVRDSRAPTLVVASVVHGELLALRPFLAGNGIVARAVFRLLITARGLDPTGAIVTERAWAAAPNPYLGAAAGFATGTARGVAAWVVACADAVVAGAQEGRTVADAVLAGRIGE